jgi:hypothetical protein
MIYVLIVVKFDAYFFTHDTVHFTTVSILFNTCSRWQAVQCLRNVVNKMHGKFYNYSICYSKFDTFVLKWFVTKNLIIIIIINLRLCNKNNIVLEPKMTV